MNLIRRTILSMCIAASAAAMASAPGAFDVVPRPRSVTYAQTADAGFTLDRNTRIVAATPAQKKNAALLAGYIADIAGFTPKIVAKAPKTNYISLTDKPSADHPEGYSLLTAGGRAEICGGSPAGTFYGIQLLRKALSESAVLPQAEVTDWPELDYRGMHFDSSRHFFTPDEVKRYIDIMAMHNINRFHWHLTDDQGWRLQLRSLPELTEKGAWRDNTVIGHNTGRYDTIPHGGFYTRDQVTDIIRYAADRHITIIPEIDLPGHMLAAMTAYPELGCTGGPYKVWNMWGISDDVLCAGNPKVYDFLDTVLGELIEIFPSEYINIGGDECPKVRWEKCPKCQAKIQELGIVATPEASAEQQLQSYVMHHAEKFLNSHGRKVIGWDEILEGGVSPTATVLSWRGEDKTRQAAALGNDIVLVPTDYFYFDYYQTPDAAGEPFECIGGCVTLPKVYSFSPRFEGLTPEQQSHIKGVQANLWTEYLSTFPQVEYMLLPRMAALSEVQWTDPSRKDYAEFTSRLLPLLRLYDRYGLNYSRRLYDVDAKTAIADGTVTVALSTTPAMPVHYTLDGSEPGAESPLYKEPLRFTGSSTLRARSIPADGRPSNVLTVERRFNKATARPVTLIYPSHPRYSGIGAQTLCDGLSGTTASRSGRWLGFVEKPLAAIIDLLEPQTISKIGFNSLIDTTDWIFPPSHIRAETSADGIAWETVWEESPAMPGADLRRIDSPAREFTPRHARYVRLTVTPATLPAWHPGAGSPAFIFVDEISVD